MAITKVNDYAVGDNNLTAFGTSIDLQRRGEGQITLSEYDTDAAPDVTIGSWFENNGTLYKIETAAETPTGYAGITNSTTFYLYYSVSGAAFIYSNTAPTWSDSKQGWYNGNDRALFSMYKDSGGTLYKDKSLLITQNKLGSPDGVQFGNTVKFKKYYKATAPTQGEIFTALESWVPSVGDNMPVVGTAYVGADTVTMVYIYRSGATTISFRGIEMGGAALAFVNPSGGIESGASATPPIEIMSNFDAIS